MLTIEEMFQEKLDAIETRIDAVTVSSAIIGNRVRSIAFVKEIATITREEYFWLDETKKTVKYGGTGWTCGSMSFLAKRDKTGKTLWNVVGITGERSREFYDMIMSYDEEYKVTRLDIAVDFAFSKPREEYLPIIYSKLVKMGLSPQLRQSTSGNTLYFGSRESGKFGRVYDKSEAYNMALGCVYRFEIEAKNEEAQKVHLLLKNAESIQKTMLDYSFKIWRSWSIPIPIGGDTVVMPKIHAVVSTDLGKLEWLMSISGSIKRLAAKYPKQVYDALGLEQLAILVADNDGLKVGDVDTGH